MQDITAKEEGELDTNPIYTRLVNVVGHNRLSGNVMRLKSCHGNSDTVKIYIYLFILSVTT